MVEMMDRGVQKNVCYVDCTSHILDIPGDNGEPRVRGPRGPRRTMEYKRYMGKFVVVFIISEDHGVQLKT